MPTASRLRHGFAVAVAGLMLAPAAASAQSAGDDQYSDPFGGDQAATPTPRAASPAAPAAPAATAVATAPAASAPTGAVPSGAPALPYTGLDAWPRALAGALVLAAGIALRVRVRERD